MSPPLIEPLDDGNLAFQMHRLVDRMEKQRLDLYDELARMDEELERWEDEHADDEEE